LKAARTNGIEIIELPIAFDGITVVVNPNNDWVDYLTMAELRAIFSKESDVTTWQDIREDWPAQPLVIYAPDYKSGTYDYFSSAVTGKDNHRDDYVANEDDNVLINGVNQDLAAIGYLGFSYFTENRDMLRAVPVDSGSGPVEPAVQTISTGEYAPLSRPLFIYVTKDQVKGNNVVTKFVTYYLQHAPEIAKQSGYIPLPGSAYEAVMKRFEDLKVGSPFLQAGETNTAILALLNSK
jgi:phosphate transport system substrate-binding protein